MQRTISLYINVFIDWFYHKFPRQFGYYSMVNPKFLNHIQCSVAIEYRNQIFLRPNAISNFHGYLSESSCLYFTNTVRAIYV